MAPHNALLRLPASHDYVNLQEMHAMWCAKHPEEASAKKNPFLKPEFFQEVLAREHARRGITWSYGGYLENRQKLWRGSYLERSQRWLHLGVDVNVPAMTPLYAEQEMEILDSWHDRDQDGGWGGVLIARYKYLKPVVLFAHLHPRYVPEKGRVFRRGHIFSHVGYHTHNGGWFEHLHIQMLSEEALAAYLNNPEVLDGYGAQVHNLALSRLYPNPLDFISLV